MPEQANFAIEFGPGDWGGFWVSQHHGINRLVDTGKYQRTDPMADARLIAAAPELLAVLKHVYQQMMMDETWIESTILISVINRAEGREVTA